MSQFFKVFAVAAHLAPAEASASTEPGGIPKAVEQALAKKFERRDLTCYLFVKYVKGEPESVIFNEEPLDPVEVTRKYSNPELSGATFEVHKKSTSEQNMTVSVEFHDIRHTVRSFLLSAKHGYGLTHVIRYFAGILSSQMTRRK